MANDSNTYDVFEQKEAQLGAVAPVTTKSDSDAEFSYRTWQQYWSHSHVWRNQVVEDWDFYLGAQLSQKQTESGKQKRQKTFNADVIYQAVEQAIALLTSNRPRFTATGTEDSDTKIANIFAYLIQHVWKESYGNTKIKQTIRDYYVGSVGWMWMYWNPLACYGKGEFVIDSIDPRRVYVDPGSRDFFFKDAAHIIVETYLTAEAMQKQYNLTVADLAQFERMPELNLASTRSSEMDSGSSSFVPNYGADTYQRLDRFSRIKEKVYRLEKEDERFEQILDIEYAMQKMKETTCIVSRRGNVTTFFVSPRNVSSVMKLYQQYGEVFHEVVDGAGQQSVMSGVEGEVEYAEGVQPVPGSTTTLMLLPLLDCVKRGVVKIETIYADRIKHIASIGKKILFEKILPSEHYPVVPLINNFDRTPYPVGDVRRVKRSQEFINSIRQIVVTHAGKVANVKIGYPIGRYDETKLNADWVDPLKTFIGYDAELSSSGLQVLAPPPLSNFIFTLEMQERKNIEERLGIFAMMQGSPSDAPNTYKGTVALDEYGQRRIRSKKDDIEEFLNQLGRVFVSLVPYYYDDTRVINVVSPNDKPMTVTLTAASKYSNVYDDNEYRIQDITVGKYDLQVVSGSTLPSNRWMLLGEYREMYKEGLVDQQAVLKKAEFPDSDEIIERMDIIKNLSAQLEQAQEQIKGLQGDMQTREREIFHTKQEAEITKMKANIKVEEGKALAARMIYENSLKILKGKNNA